VLLNLPSSLYAAAATFRRQWYTGHPDRQRRLSRPVVSVGNLRVGGSGKTPIVAALARELLQRGWRPSILSRGYARPTAARDPTIVSDGHHILAAFDTAGDEALMLARQLPGIPVVVCPSRYAAGIVAEQQLGATVHLLDDGFQHLTLARDVDLLVVDESDLYERPLPAGRLREPLAAARHATALLTTASPEGVERLRAGLRIATVFRVTRRLASPSVWSANASCSMNDPVLAVAGIARPERFFTDLADAGWKVADTMAFPDHHRFTDADVARIAETAARTGVRCVLTTEKDAARLESLDVRAVPFASVPLTADLEPAFYEWLIGQLGGR
jgi:tetraacyldisaccharide 4'-kinase